MASQRSPLRLLLIDLDNTVYDWVALFAAAIRAMVDAVAPRLDLSPEIVRDQFRAVYANHRSLEYAFLVQEIEACRDLDPSDVIALADLARRAYRQAADVRLRAYPGVREALKEAKSFNIMVCGISNAPAYQAQRRLRLLDLSTLFDGLAVWHGFDIPDNDPYAKEVRRRINAGVGRPVIREWRFAADELKPTPVMYERILGDLSISPAEVLVVGDSVRRDLAPAAALGMEVAWAAYGTRVDPDDLDLVIAMTPWSQQEVQSEYTVNPGEFAVLKDGWDLYQRLRAEASEVESPARLIAMPRPHPPGVG